MNKLTKVLVGLAAVAVIACVAAVVLSLPKGSNSSPNDDSVIINQDVIIYEEGKSPFRITASNDTSITVSSTEGIEVGKIIASDVTEATPVGLLRRVTGIRENPDGSATLATTPAALTEAIDYCDIHQSAIFNEDGTYTYEQGETDADDPLGIKKAYAAEKDQSFDIDFSGCNFQSDYRVEFDLKIDHGEIDIELVLHIEAELYQGNISGSFEKELATKDLPPFIFHAGPLPLVFKNALTVSVEGNAERYNSTTDVAVLFDRKIGFRYSSNSGLRPVNEDNSSASDKSDAADKGDSLLLLDLNLPIEWSAFLYGLAGPTLEVDIASHQELALTPVPEGTPATGAFVSPLSGQAYFGEYALKITLPISGNLKCDFSDFNPFDLDFIAGLEEGITLFDTGDLVTLLDVNISFGDVPDKSKLNKNTKKTEVQAPSSNPNGTDIMVVLDTSGSMGGDPIESASDAVTGFVDKIVIGNTRVGIIAYNNNAGYLSPVSSDSQALQASASGISAGGGTNIDAALQLAFDTLELSDAAKKAVVLMSDGEPSTGRKGQELIRYAVSEKEGALGSDSIRVYTLGFNEGAAGFTLLSGIADAGRHYEIEDSGDLDAFFNDIADDINGVGFVYTRIPTPVGVKVVHNGETLNTATDSGNDRTSFGSITYEDEINDQGKVVTEDAVKVLRLREGEEYDIEFTGTPSGNSSGTSGGSASGTSGGSSNDKPGGSANGTSGGSSSNKPNGTSNGTSGGTAGESSNNASGSGSSDSLTFSVSYVDEKGNYTDTRTFTNLPINARTRAVMHIASGEDSVLKVDEDGDGQFDAAYVAKPNSEGMPLDNSSSVSKALWISIGITLAVSLLALGLTIWRIVASRRTPTLKVRE